MNTKTKLAIMAGAFSLAVQSQASITEFNLYFNDGVGDTLTGDLAVSYHSPGEYLATGGSLYLSSTSSPSLDGTYALVPGGPGNNYQSVFVYDNILYYPGNPIVDFSGALVLQNSTGTYLNLFSDGGQNENNYALYTENQALWPQNVSIWSNETAPATAILTPVPESSTMLAGALMILPFGLSAIRIIRKRAVA